ncbi:MAG: YciI family protein [Candidatus Limnocylindrales bacterium]
MRYLLLIYTAEPNEPIPDQEMGTELAAYGDFTRWTQENGSLRAGEALQPTSTATTVRVRDDRTITTDGPYAETKEQLGGFYLLDVANIDEAIEAASRIPGARHGAIEVRPIMELPSMDTSEAVAAAH